MADELTLDDIFNLDEEKLSIISESLRTFLPSIQNDESDSDAINFDELDHAIVKDDETPTPVTPVETDKCAASDGSGFVEVDDAIIKDDEFQSLLKSLAPPEIDLSAISYLFDFDQVNLAIKNLDFGPLQTCLASIDSDSDDFNFDEHYSVNNNDNNDEFESLLANLAPVETGICADDVINYDDILKHICNCVNHHKRTKDDVHRDIRQIVNIGLSHGDIRKDQLEYTVSGGAERIVELAYWYKIPLRSAPGERIRLRSDTLTFVRAISCFPHFASFILFNVVGFAKNGEKSVLASEQLPDAMKHSGFYGLIPKCCDPYLMKAYSFAHPAYMVDFGKMINSGDKRSLKTIALSQLDYSKSGAEKLPYSDEFKVGILRAVGLTDPDVFKKIVDVCNNLCKVVGEPELAFATAEKNHIKNNMICFFEDDTKDVAAGWQTKDLADKLRDTSIHDA